MGVATIDTENLKRQADCRDILGARVELRNETAGGRELSGPCPKCGGEDRCHVTAAWFFCRECHEKRGDAIELVQWLGLAHDFRSACDYLGGPVMAAMATTVKRSPDSRNSTENSKWNSPWWQQAARSELTQAQRTLCEASVGEPGRDYLIERGIMRDTWRNWGLGYKPDVWDPKLAEHLQKTGVSPDAWPSMGYGVAEYKGSLYATRPAIVIPWQRDKITALKYRFLTVPAGGMRYSSKSGSEFIAFGLGLAGDHYGTLWLCEGELNAIALWQTMTFYFWSNGVRVNWDVLSFGGEGRAAALHDVLAQRTKKYLEVIVWADNEDKAAEAMRAIPGAKGLRSPKHEGHKLDASELGRRGLLGEFVATAEARFDADHAHLAWLQRELPELSGGTNGV